MEEVTVSQSQGVEVKLFGVKALSVYLSIPVSSLYSMVSLKKIPGVVRVGRSLRFEKAEIDRWVLERREGPSS